MKKSLIALAVLAASGASFAQSNVTLYGLADVYIGSSKAADKVTATSTSRTTAMGSGAVDTSRWGVKGSEDLGGGLKANFKLEQGFQLDTGAANPTFTDTFGTKSAAAAFSRYAYVGFSGGFGEVKLGKTGTAYDDMQGAGDAVFDSALSAVAGTWKSTGYNWNPANTVLYASPVMGGFSGEVSYSLGEAASNSGNISSFHVKYAAGPIYAGLGYQVEKPNGVAGVTTIETKFTRLNGTYDFGMAKLLLAYGKVVTTAAADVNEYQIGVDVPVAPAITLSGNFAQSKTGSFAGASEQKRTGFGLGANYVLSKRTYVYGGYRGETNDQGGAGDLKTSLFAVGVHHVF